MHGVCTIIAAKIPKGPFAANELDCLRTQQGFFFDFIALIEPYRSVLDLKHI